MRHDQELPAFRYLQQLRDDRAHLSSMAFVERRYTDFHPRPSMNHSRRLRGARRMENLQVMDDDDGSLRCCGQVLDQRLCVRADGIKPYPCRVRAELIPSEDDLSPHIFHESRGGDME